MELSFSLKYVEESVSFALVFHV